MFRPSGSLPPLSGLHPPSGSVPPFCGLTKGGGQWLALGARPLPSHPGCDSLAQTAATRSRHHDARRVVCSSATRPGPWAVFFLAAGLRPPVTRRLLSLSQQVSPSPRGCGPRETASLAPGRRGLSEGAFSLPPGPSPRALDRPRVAPRLEASVLAGTLVLSAACVAAPGRWAANAWPGASETAPTQSTQAGTRSPTCQQVATESCLASSRAEVTGVSPLEQGVSAAPGPVVADGPLGAE